MLCDGGGRAVAATLTAGERHETTQVGALLDQALPPGAPGRFTTIAGDKGYDQPSVREAITRRGAAAVIAHRRRRDGSYPPEAAGFDRAAYRRRNVIERLIGRVKECRHVATRYDKLAASYLAFVRLAFARISLKALLPYTA